MTAKLFAILLSLLIFACPLNCMQGSVETADSDTPSCCQHCQSTSTENPLAPTSNPAEGCQCFCTGAILERVDQLDQSHIEALWLAISSLNVDGPQFPIDSAIDVYTVDVSHPAGRALRHLHMSFQC